MSVSNTTLDRQDQGINRTWENARKRDYQTRKLLKTHSSRRFCREGVQLSRLNFHSAFTLPKLGMIYAKNGLGGESDGEEHRKPL